MTVDVVGATVTVTVTVALQADGDWLGVEMGEELWFLWARCVIISVHRRINPEPRITIDQNLTSLESWQNILKDFCGTKG